MAKKDRRIGATIAGKYRIVRLLGTGSMGDVYEAVHVEIGKRIALKMMSAMHEAPEIVERFRREARAAGTIESDYVVQVFDAGDDPGLGLYMACEFLDGEDLEARLAREDRLEPDVAAVLGFQIARGLAKAHAKGIVHRDLKPANIFLTTRDDGSMLTKILDFGISKVTIDDVAGEGLRAHGRDGPALTAVGLTLGTPQYMSPEQVMALPDLDARTDIWSLAAVLYEALAGTPAIAERPNAIAILTAIIKEPVRPLRQIAPWVPEALAAVVQDGLIRERDRRIPSAAAFAERLLEACPEEMAATGVRFSMPQMRAAPAVRSPQASEKVVAAPAAAPPPTPPPREGMPLSEIPLSISFEPGSEPPPATVRDFQLTELGQVPETSSVASSVPPPSQPIEIFQRLPVGRPVKR